MAELPSKRPTLHVAQPEESDPLTAWRERWNKLTQEDRARMTVPELIKAMGPLHALDKRFVKRPRSLLPLPNLTGVHGHVIEHHDARFRAQWKRMIAWALR